MNLRTDISDEDGLLHPQVRSEPAKERTYVTLSNMKARSTRRGHKVALLN